MKTSKFNPEDYLKQDKELKKEYDKLVEEGKQMNKAVNEILNPSPPNEELIKAYKKYKQWKQ